MRKTNLPAHVVVMLLLLVAPLAGVDCDETGDLLRGTDSRLLFSSILNAVSQGAVEAVVCTTVGVTAGLVEDGRSTVCPRSGTTTTPDTGLGEITIP